MTRASKSCKSPGFSQFLYSDRPAFLGLMRASRPAFNVWFFMYMSSEYRNGVFICRVAQEYIEVQTGHGHNQVDDAKALLRDNRWIIPIGEQGMHGDHGHWDTGVYQVRVGTVPSQKGLGKKSQKADTVPPPEGCRPYPRRGGTIVDTHKSVLHTGGRGGLCPPVAEGEKSEATGVADEQSIADAIAPAAAVASPVSWSAIAEIQNQKPNPNPKTAGGNPLQPPRGGTGVFKSRVPEPKTEAEELACLLWHYIQGRISLGHKIEVPYKWLKLWSSDFQGLIDDGRNPADIKLAIWASQWPGKQVYYIRAKSICDQIDMLSESGTKRERLFRLHVCNHPDCPCWFSNARDYQNHLTMAHADAQPPVEVSNAEEEEAWLYAEDFLTQEGGALGDEDSLDPFDREEIMADDDGQEVWEEVAPGHYEPVKKQEDWGQHDFDFELPEPFKEPPKGRVRPEGEREDKRDWVRRAEAWGHTQRHADNGNGGEEPPSHDF